MFSPRLEDEFLIFLTTLFLVFSPSLFLSVSTDCHVAFSTEAEVIMIDSIAGLSPAAQIFLFY